MENKIYTKTMTSKEREKNVGKVLRNPLNYHLIDCLKDLKYGRPAKDQKLINSFMVRISKQQSEKEVMFCACNKPIRDAEYSDCCGICGNPIKEEI